VPPLSLKPPWQLLTLTDAQAKVTELELGLRVENERKAAAEGRPTLNEQGTRARRDSSTQAERPDSGADDGKHAREREEWERERAAWEAEREEMLLRERLLRDQEARRELEREAWERERMEARVLLLESEVARKEAEHGLRALEQQWHVSFVCV